MTDKTKPGPREPEQPRFYGVDIGSGRDRDMLFMRAGRAGKSIMRETLVRHIDVSLSEDEVRRMFGEPIPAGRLRKGDRVAIEFDTEPSRRRR